MNKEQLSDFKNPYPAIDRRHKIWNDGFNKAMEMPVNAAAPDMYEALNGTVTYLIELAAAFDNERAFKDAIFKRIEKIKSALNKANGK